jgi:hypothetical protein
MKKLSVITAFLFTAALLHAQDFTKVITAADRQLPFKEAAKKINHYFDTLSNNKKEENGREEEGGNYTQWKRTEWFAMQHLNSNGMLENYAMKNAAVKSALPSFTNMPNSPLNNYGAWASLGHTNSSLVDFAVQGRINCLAFEPGNPAVVFAGAAGGGIWKSTDYGTSWQSITDNLPILGISSIAVDPTNGNIIYAITGDGNGPGAYSHRGFGIIKSTNGGASWVTLAFSPDPADFVAGGYKLLIDPANHNIIFAAMKSGLWKSTNAGASWNKLRDGSVTDIEFKPGNSSILYFASSGENSLYTLNLTTSQLVSKAINFARPITRMEIAVTPANPNAVFVLAGPSWSSPAGCVPGAVPVYNGLFYSPDEATPFGLRSNNLDIFGMCNDQSGYDIAIYVSPSNENVVLIAGVRCYVSNNGGFNFSQANDPANSVSHDCHAIEKNPSSGDIYVGNDGGVNRSTNAGASWSTASNGLVASEYYRLSGYQGSNNLILGGTQDNGLLIRNSTSSTFYSPNILLDFMDNIIDHTNSNIMYACWQNGGLNKSVNGGNTFSGVAMPPGTTGSWITPIIQSPTAGTANTIYYGAAAGILRTTNGGTSWVNIGGQAYAACLGIGTDGTNFSLYSSENRFLKKCNNPLAATPVWQDITPPNSSRISAIAVNPANKSEIWITCSGYQTNEKVFRSLDAGATWANLSLSLPNIPIYSIAFANNTNAPGGAVYAGTELGVYYTDDGIPDWEPYYNGLPMVPVVDLFVNYSSGDITAATFGRGIWRSAAYTSCPGSYSITGTVTGKKFFQSGGEINSYQVVPGSIGNELHIRAASKVKLMDGFRAYNGSALRVVIGPCGSGVVSKQVEAGTAANKTDSVTAAVSDKK